MITIQIYYFLKRCAIAVYIVFGLWQDPCTFHLLTEKHKTCQGKKVFFCL
nr:MAG TPA: hypothetical protein [Caudoviricetes sp.]